MARVETVSLLDDLDGVPADETVEFALDGKSYEVDLASANASKLRDALGPFIAAGRVATRRPAAATSGSRRRSGGSSADAAERERNRVIREWALGQGFKVSERGRMPADVLAAYAAAHPNGAAPAGDVRTGHGTARVSIGAG